VPAILSNNRETQDAFISVLFIILTQMMLPESIRWRCILGKMLLIVTLTLSFLDLAAATPGQNFRQPTTEWVHTSSEETKLPRFIIIRPARKQFLFFSKLQHFFQRAHFDTVIRVSIIISERRSVNSRPDFFSRRIVYAALPIFHLLPADPISA
jgi:hypothetical protein